MAPRSNRFAVLVLCALGCLPAVHAITYTIDEEVAPDFYIGNVSADSGLKDIVGENDFANLRYSVLSGGSDTSQLFKISATTGVLTVASRIDREQLCPFKVTCNLTIEIAAQYESLLRKFNVMIVIEDINDNSPTFSQSSTKTFELSETTSVGFPLSLDTATDLDGTKNFSVQNYSLVPEDVPFRVMHSVNLVGVPQLSLVVSEQLDRERQASYSLTVWAYDGGSPPRSGSVALTITVLDVNDNAPKFSQDVYSHNISESTPPGTPILTVSASDDDEGDNAKVVYSISSQQPDQEQEKFNIDNTTGLVTTAHTLKAGVHRVLIEAQDQGMPPKPPTQAVVKVTVLDTDNGPPVLNFDMLSVSDFEPGHVPESAKPSTAVGYLAVSDPDSGANALVTCSSKNDHFDLKPLNLNEYKVIINKTLDRETTAHFNVPLVCFDGGDPKLTSSVLFDVWVVDVNDNAPVFLNKQYTTSVVENNGHSDGLLRVVATDADSGNNANVSYRLVGEEGLFQVGAHNGMIQTQGQLDYENRTEYVFHVLAVDQGDPPLTGTATITISVLDENDEVPHFTADNYTMTVVEGQAPGMVVGNVSASDRDSGSGGEIVLSIVPQPGLVLPFLLSQTGDITTTSSLDREQRASYTFYILARDRGLNPLSASVLVKVDVVDINDNAPSFVFTHKNATQITVPVDAQFVVANIRAIDSDAGPNGVVTYSVVGGNASHFFRIEQTTGAVVTLVDLNQENIGWYQVVVRATDQGTTPLHTDYNLTLHVTQKTSLGSGAGSEDEEGENYIIIVVCIVAFTFVVSAAVLVTLCVLRRLDQNKLLKYTAACCPEGQALPDSHGPSSGGPRSPTHYQQQVSAVSRGVDSKTKTIGGSVAESEYGSQHLAKDGGSLSMASQELMGFSHHPSSDLKTSHLHLPLSSTQHLDRKTPLQVDLTRRADDFHSTSSTETTTGDSGHGSDDDMANHSHDTTLSPSHPFSYHHQHPNNHHQAPPRPLRMGGRTSSLSRTGSGLLPDSSRSGYGSGSIPETSRSGFGSGSIQETFKSGAGSFADTSRSGVVSFADTSRSRAGSGSGSIPDASRSYFGRGSQFRGSKPQSTVRFAEDVTDFDSRGRYESADSIRDDDSDLNTTTSGSFSVPPDDLYADYRQVQLGYHSGDNTARYHGGGGGGGVHIGGASGKYHRDMVV